MLVHYEPMVDDDLWPFPLFICIVVFIYDYINSKCGRLGLGSTNVLKAPNM